MTDLYLVSPRVSCGLHGVRFGYDVRRIPSDYPCISRLVRDCLAESQRQAVSLASVSASLERKGFEPLRFLSPLREIGIDYSAISHDASYFVLSHPHKESPIND